MQRSETVNYLVNGKTYIVNIIYKSNVNNMYLKPNKDGLTYKLTCNYFTKREVIDKFINRVIVKLEARVVKPISPFVDNKVYLFSNLIEVKKTLFTPKYFNNIFYVKKEKDLENILKIILLNFVKERVKYYSKEMKIKTEYDIVIKDYKGRYGTNFGNKNLLSFTLNLVHYSQNVIDSVIVHELAHDKVRDHSNKFYELVLKHYPDYWKYHDALVKYDYECK